MRNLSLFIFFLSLMTIAHAEVYQWKDASGKIHYGEQNAGADKKNITTVEIRDKYHISPVESKAAIQYTSKTPHRQVSFNNLKLILPDSENEDVRVGRIICGAPIDLYWQKGFVDFSKPEVIQGSIAKFSELGYSVRNGIKNSASPTSLSLEAEIIDIKVNKCPSNKSKDISQNATYLKIKWNLSDPLSGKVHFTGESAGSHDALSARAVKSGADISFDAALAVATNNLLADTAFIKAIAPIDMTTLATKFDEKIIVRTQYGTGSGSFKEQADTLMKNTVIVKTKEGFGSGVVINNEGYLLTNAHVVGDATKFSIIIGDNTINAVLVRKEVVRDVALIKITDNFSTLQGVNVSRALSKVGDEIYIIGAPLSLENSQTTTKGIVSAYRSMQGLRYLQTDASVNHGSSGGPVFNEHGELIALTVSGLLTKDGAGLGINYLIPINDAFRYLNLDNAANENNAVKTINTFIEKLPLTDNKNSFLFKFNPLVAYIIDWLNSPLWPTTDVAEKSIAIAQPESEPLPQLSGLTELPKKMYDTSIARAKFSEALIRVNPLRTLISSYYSDQNKWPNHFSDIDIDGDTLKHPKLIEKVGIELGGSLHVDLSPEIFGEDQYFELTPDTTNPTLIDWVCKTTLSKPMWVGNCEGI